MNFTIVSVSIRHIAHLVYRCMLTAATVLTVRQDQLDRNARRISDGVTA